MRWLESGNSNGGNEVYLSDLAKSQLKRFKKMGYGNFPVCLAKT